MLLEGRPGALECPGSAGTPGRCECDYTLAPPGRPPAPVCGRGVRAGRCPCTACRCWGSPPPPAPVARPGAKAAVSTRWLHACAVTEGCPDTARCPAALVASPRTWTAVRHRHGDRGRERERKRGQGVSLTHCSQGVAGSTARALIKNNTGLYRGRWLFIWLMHHREIREKVLKRLVISVCAHYILNKFTSLNVFC